MAQSCLWGAGRLVESVQDALESVPDAPDASALERPDAGHDLVPSDASALESALRAGTCSKAEEVSPTLLVFGDCVATSSALGC